MLAKSSWPGNVLACLRQLLTELQYDAPSLLRWLGLFRLTPLRWYLGHFFLSVATGNSCSVAP